MGIDIVIIFSIITALAFILLVVTFFSYYHNRNLKLLFISSIFLFLFIRGVLLSLGLFNNSISSITSSPYIWIFDLIILVFLYAAYSIKR